MRDLSEVVQQIATAWLLCSEVMDMDERELKHDLTPAEERQAESHFCRKWGEPLAEGASRPESPLRNGLDDELDAVERTLQAAYAFVPADAGFTARVMKALPPEPDTGPLPKTLALPRKTRSLSWIWGVAGSVAALVLLFVCLGLPGLQNSSMASVAKGQVVNANGELATNLSPGQTYRVAGSEAVVRVGQDAAVRLLEASQFEVPLTENDALRLHEGWAYANNPSQASMRLESDDLTADIHGVSLVVQTAAQPQETMEGLVVVFKGQALVRQPMSENTLVLKEGQMFTVSLGSHVVEPFLARAPEVAQELEQTPTDPAQLRELRRQYLAVVAGYQRELAFFTKELASTRDLVRRAELVRRQKLVEQYLAQHQQRLESLPDLSENETPKDRARRVRRAAEQIQRGRKSFSNPRQWL